MGRHGPSSVSGVFHLPTPAPGNSARLPRDVYVLGIIAFFVAVGFGVIVPVLPVVAKSFGVNTFAVGAVVSGFALMRLVTAPVVPRLGRLLGQRTTLGVGILVVGLSSAAAGLAQTYPRLLVMRGVGGIGSAMFSVSATTLLVGAVGPELRGRASALYSSGFLIGGMAGPAVGAVLAAISLRAPFFFYAVTLVVAGFVGLAMLRPPSADDAGRLGRGMRLRTAWADVRYRAALLTVFAQGWQSNGVRSTLVPVIVVTTLHRTPTWTAIAFAAASVVQTLTIGPAGRAVDTRGRRPAMIAAGVITGVAAFATPLANSIWVLTVVLCVYAVGSALHATAPTAVVGDVVGPAGGQPIAVFSMTGDVGAIIGPLVAGAVADAVSVPAAFAIGAALLLAGAAYSSRMPRDRGIDRPAAPPDLPPAPPTSSESQVA